METMDITTDDGKEKTCFVAYSLGNFFSSQNSSYASGCEESVILNLQFTKNGETGETALTNVSYTPLYLLDSGKDDQLATLEGYIVQQVKHEKYMFRDSTGEMLVEIDDEVFKGQRVDPKTKVRIDGELERDFMEKDKVDVYNLTILR